MGDPVTDFEETLASHRSELLRHCYRMLGSFIDAEDLVQDVLLSAWKSRDGYAGEAPVRHWLMRIATNACLNELARRRRRGLPQLDRAPAAGRDPIELCEASEWVTPAPDARLFPEPGRSLELRESVALAFLALLQRLPPRQRAVLLLKDVVGFTAEEIATALGLSIGSVSSALHRARTTIAATPSPEPSSDPPPEILHAYLRSWESHDVDAMVALMRDDIVFAMPPHSTWFRGPADLEAFLRTPVFTERWDAGFRIVPTRANGELALAFYRGEGGAYVRSSLQVVRFVGDRLAEIVAFVGPAYLRGFAIPDRL